MRPGLKSAIRLDTDRARPVVEVDLLGVASHPHLLTFRHEHVLDQLLALFRRKAGKELGALGGHLRRRDHIFGYPPTFGLIRVEPRTRYHSAHHERELSKLDCRHLGFPCSSLDHRLNYEYGLRRPPGMHVRVGSAERADIECGSTSASGDLRDESPADRAVSPPPEPVQVWALHSGSPPLGVFATMKRRPSSEHEEEKIAVVVEEHIRVF